MKPTNRRTGRLLQAPENYVPHALATEICASGLNDTRRAFLRKSFLGAVAASRRVSVSRRARGQRSCRATRRFLRSYRGRPVLATRSRRSVMAFRPNSVICSVANRPDSRASPRLQSRLRRCRACSESLRPAVCTLNDTIRVGSISIPTSIAS